MIKGTRIFKVTGLTNVDPKAFNQYKDWKEIIDKNTFNDGDADKFKNKAIANYRWMLISIALNKGLETLSNIKINGGSSKDVPTSVDFVLTYTQPDALWVEVDESEYIADDPEIIKTNNGRVLFLGSKAITRILENTLNQKYEVILTYFSPEKVNKEHESKLAKGTVMEELEVTAVPSTASVDEDVLTYSRFDGEDDYPNLDADENE
jgi:hypothetical protein